MERTGRCIVFAAGDCRGLELEIRDDDFVIAADAGFENCRACGVSPDLVMGDFDSMQMPECCCEVLRFPVEKDDTDTMLAIKKGIDLGFCEFHILCGCGGPRLDHTIANIQGLGFLASRGMRGYLYDRDYVYTAMGPGSVEIPKRKEWAVLSLFALSGEVRGLTLKGVQYPLTDGVLKPDFPLGVSNHIIDEKAVIEVGEGILTLCWEE